MGTEVVRRLPIEIPEAYRVSDDSRIQWLWSQRLIVVQSIYVRTKSPRDRMAAALVLSAAWGRNLPAIELVLKRLEGGAVSDEEVVEQDSTPI